jgi:predicted ATPase
MKTAFLTRVMLRNFKSIGDCDVRLAPLTYLVGGNGSGKSNFLDALHLVRDALSGSLDNALNARGGLGEVRRRSGGHPTTFSIRLEFSLPDGRQAYYAFSVKALLNGNYEVEAEECAIGSRGLGPYFKVERGQVVRTSEDSFPALTSDRLALVSVSGLVVFRPVFDALTRMGFYNLNPKVMREYQTPQDGRFLKPAGENIASVIGHLERVAPQSIQDIESYLQTVVPSVHGMKRAQLGSMDTLEFRQDVAGQKFPWHFYAQNMSDGTLRALGVLTALFQSNSEYTPSLIGIEEPETALHPAASASLREALTKASERTQIIVTSHSPDLLDDSAIPPESFLAVVSEEGKTRIAPLDAASLETMRKHLFSAGELLRLNQLEPDRESLQLQAQQQQKDLFGDLYA